MVCLLLTPATAQTGSYGPAQYSGGQYTITGTTDPVDDSAVGSGWGTTIGAPYGRNNTQPLSLTINCSKAIQASFVWTPAKGQTNLTDPPPAVIFTENCQTTWSGSSGGGLSATGSCSNPLGGSPTDKSPGPGQDWYATSYSGASGAATVSPVAREPKDMVTGTATAQAGNGVAQTILIYTVTAAPVTISLPGTTPDASGHLHILVGQRCSATLSGIPSGTGWSSSPYSWSVTGKTVQNTSWVVSPDFSNAKFTAQANPYTSTQTSPTWYWDDITKQQTVTCTVTLTPPAGQGAAFTVTAVQNVTVDVPTPTNSDTTGAVLLNQADPYDPGSLDLWAGTGNGQTPGIIFSDTVTTPPTPYSGGGTWYHIQLVALNASATPKAGGAAVPLPGNSTTGTLDYINGAKPTTYIYDNRFNADGKQGSFSSGVYDIDAPDLPVDDKYKEYNVMSETFSDYIMYTPPGTGSIAVPLAYFTWTWNVDVKDQPTPGTWELWKNAATGGTLTTSGKATRVTDYPQWTAFANKTSFP